MGTYIDLDDVMMILRSQDNLTMSDDSLLDIKEKLMQYAFTGEIKHEWGKSPYFANYKDCSNYE